MPNLSSNKNKMALPNQLNPVGSVCIPVNVPNDPEWIGMFLGAIYRLSQQVWYDRDANHSAKIVAARWQDVYLETVKATWDCGALDLFDIRVNPEDECSIQKTLDGVVWSEVFRLDGPCSVTRIRRNPATGRIGYVMEDFTFYEFPDGPYVPPSSIVYPEPKQRETSSLTSRCNGAYAAALALQMLYRETWGKLAQLATTGAFVMMRELADISSVVLGAIGLFDEYLNIVEDLAQESALFVEGGFPDSYVEDVTNILYCRSSFVDGAVYFNHAGVIADFQALSASGPYGGLSALLTLWISEDALNAAGNINAGSGTCAPCSDWCYRFEFNVSNGGFSGIGSWDGTQWQSIAQGGDEILHIKRAVSEGLVTRVRYGYAVNGWSSNNNLGTLMFWNNSTLVKRVGPTHDHNAQVSGTWDSGEFEPVQIDEVGIEQDNYGTTGRWSTVQWVEYSGIGDSPFGVSNC